MISTEGIVRTKMAIKYLVEDRFATQPCRVINHGMFDITPEKKQPVEDFVGFIHSITDHDRLKEITLTVKTSNTPLIEK